MENMRDNASRARDWASIGPFQGSDLSKEMSALLRNASTSANFAEPQRNDPGAQTVQHLFEIVYNSDS
jgi:hypothetical protein